MRSFVGENVIGGINSSAVWKILLQSSTAGSR